jgi:hypothetical protein
MTRNTMTRSMISSHALLGLGLVLGCLISLGACDIPECIDGPSNLTPESTESCEPSATPAESEILNAGAELLDNGGLILTWTSWGMECGIRAFDVEFSDDCERTGWIFTIEIPPELVAPGVLDLAAHPEILGSMTVIHGGDAGSTGNIGDEPFFVGELELVQLGADCVTGVLHGFGTGSLDPTLGGPELDGSFLAPTC